MVIRLPGIVDRSAKELLPREIVDFLDRYIVGQNKAKRAVAKALRDRYRQRKISGAIAKEIFPKNIIMIGSTGVGKTEIARRLSNLTKAPFIKVEASKYTEVGYVGRDVESMVRDITENAIAIVKAEEIENVRAKAKINVEEKLLDLLIPPQDSSYIPLEDDESNNPEKTMERTRQRFREQLKAGQLEDKIVRVPVQHKSLPAFEIVAGSSLDEMNMNIQEMMSGLMSGKKKDRKMTISDARDYLLVEEQEKLLDMDKISSEAVQRVESSGIIFIDEIDKVAGQGSKSGPDVSREGVQRDILPIIEGTTVTTKYGPVKTDHILFIAAGAFHISKPSDLIPELQGRFPIRVELDSLNKDDFVRILKEPENSLIKQYEALMNTEGISLKFTDDGVEAIADVAFKLNETTENIGARRLHTVMEKLLDEISYVGPELKEKKQIIDAPFVGKVLSDIIEDQDLSRYIL